MQSGKPVGVFRTHEWAPRVLIANSNLVGDWATWPEFRRLEALGLTMYGQMTAGSWIYIGTQGILQGTYETFAARRREARLGAGDACAGTLTLTGGCGGMGGAQPLAVTLNEGVVLIVDVDESRLQRRVEHGYLDEMTDRPRRRHRPRASPRRPSAAPLSVGLVGNAATVFPELLRRGCRSTSSPTRPARTTRSPTCRRASPSTTGTPTPPPTRGLHRARPRHRWPSRSQAMVEFQDAGAEVFDYGNSIRAEAQLGGYDRAFDFPGFVPAYIRPLFAEGKGPFRWAALSGDPADIARDRQGDPRALPRGRRTCAAGSPQAGEKVHFEGLPARICWLGYKERHLAGLKFNEMVASGELSRARS